MLYFANNFYKSRENLETNGEYQATFLGGDGGPGREAINVDHITFIGKARVAQTDSAPRGKS